MKPIDKVRKIKEIKREWVVFIKVGVFYEVYNKDACIVSFLFNYKIRKVGKNIVCGFSNIEKVKDKLNRININYIIIDKDIKYFGFKDNNYSLIYDGYYKSINNLLRIKNIIKYLKSNINKLDMIERLIYE